MFTLRQNYQEIKWFIVNISDVALPRRDSGSSALAQHAAKALLSLAGNEQHTAVQAPLNPPQRQLEEHLEAACVQLYDEVLSFLASRVRN